jgi:DNA-directed RNA polymerase specialized sigma24 family protein
MTADLLDQQDVRASMAGDGEAYRRLVTRHQPALAAYLWRFTRDRRECEELVQETR